jgi:hypothetical protein
MPMLINRSRSIMILEHVTDEPIVLKHNQSVEVPEEALSLPLIQHYLEVKRLDLVRRKPEVRKVILSR